MDATQRITIAQYNTKFRSPDAEARLLHVATTANEQQLPEYQSWESYRSLGTSKARYEGIEMEKRRGNAHLVNLFTMPENDNWTESMRGLSNVGKAEPTTYASKRSMPLEPDSVSEPSNTRTHAPFTRGVPQDSPTTTTAQLRPLTAEESDLTFLELSRLPEQYRSIAMWTWDNRMKRGNVDVVTGFSQHIDRRLELIEAAEKRAATERLLGWERG